MQIENEELELVKALLTRHLPGYHVWAFGSRVHGKHLRKFSDLDLVIHTDTPVPLETIINTKSAFSESDLPFRVDLSDWTRLPGPIQEIIRQHYEQLC